MTRARWMLGVAVVLVVGLSPVRADSLPRIAGNVYGIELCPQSICQSAIFVGVFQGRVGLNPNAIGTFATAVTHEDLPPPYTTSAITGGLWALSTLLWHFEGGTTGTLYNNGDNSYTVTVNMRLTGGGLGRVTFVGRLDHNVFPPTIIGQISQ